MSNGWTEERKVRQAALIHTWKPWQSAGVKTPEGKKRSRMNALKHGKYTASAIAERKRINQVLRDARDFIKRAQRMLADG